LQLPVYFEYFGQLNDPDFLRIWEPTPIGFHLMIVKIANHHLGDNPKNHNVFGFSEQVTNITILREYSRKTDNTSIKNWS
jgi:hypothetical protein